MSSEKVQAVLMWRMKYTEGKSFPTSALLYIWYLVGAQEIFIEKKRTKGLRCTNFQL